MRISGLTIAAGLALALAASAVAQTPPDHNNAKAVQKWIGENKLIEKNAAGRVVWNIVGAAADGVYWIERYYDTGGVRTPTFQLRQERFQPITVRDQQVLSHLFEYEINCRSKQIRRKKISVFAGHNMTGASISQAVDEPWASVDTVPMLRTPSVEICEAMDAQGGTRGNATGNASTQESLRRRGF